jgi:predicted metal-binding transcription factor (methanogenesis marker protein 9)
MKYNYIHSLYSQSQIQIYKQKSYSSSSFVCHQNNNISDQYKMETEKEKAETIIDKVTILDDKEKEKFLNSLNEKELKAYAIAKSFLNDTFDFNKSNKFVKWKSLQSSSPF